MRFVNLKVHSIYSVLKGTMNARAIANKAASLNHSAVCLTDWTLCGALEFSTSCLEFNVKPMIGCRVMINFEVDALSPISVTLIVKTSEGYVNLLALINGSVIIDDIYIIKYKDFISRGKGLTILIGERCENVDKLFQQFGPECLLEKLNMLHCAIETVCIEIQRSTFTDALYEDTLKNFANERRLLTVATNETYFADKEDFEVYEIMRNISRQPSHGITIDNFFKDYRDMLPRHSDDVLSLNNTILLSKQCNFWLEKQKVILPKIFENRKMEHKLLYLRSIQALEYTFYTNGWTNKRLYYERLLQELAVIALADYAGYFLVVADFVSWSRDHDVYVGPGRGSATGSLMAYCLGITQVDPLQHGLLFERFLNLSRNNIPDIDIDFCQRNRENVIRYAQSRYGIERVGQIMTFGTFQAKNAVRDIGKCLNIPPNIMNEFCRIAAAYNFDLAKLQEVMIEHDPADSVMINKLLEVTAKILGVYKLMSTHAAGIIIDNSTLGIKTPTVWDDCNEINVVQQSMSLAESVGLTKFDLLGLQTLTSLSDVLEEIHSERFYVTLGHEDDDETFRAICDGRVLNLFQLEGGGIKRQIEILQPSNLDDLAALVALYRPGPMKHLKLYSDVKHKRIPKSTLHKTVDHLLNRTYGIVIYQEQVMLIAQAFAGYTLTEADMLRQAMAKKNKTEMAIQRVIFAEGAKKFNKISNKVAFNIFDTLARFADYGFNKSHAIAYGILAYVTGYLKTHFPLEFYSINMTAELIDQAKVSDLYYEARRTGVIFIGPNVKSSTLEFEIGNNFIQFPLNYIKGVGNAVATDIIEVRDKLKYKDLTEFCKSMNYKFVTKRVLKHLIHSGALDCFEADRSRLIQSIDLLRDCVKKKTDFTLEGKRKIGKRAKWKLWREEYLALGCYVSELPITPKVEGSNKTIAVIVNQWPRYIRLVTNENRFDVISNLTHRVKIGLPYACEIKQSVCVKVSFINI
ncbi:MAG: DNA polymerase III subunit alpha [Candidatus Hodgkinia cicadicola]